MIEDDDTSLSGPVEQETRFLSRAPGATGQIGDYRLIQKLGEGGMGEVYQAEQLRPVRRSVALKIIKLGMDTREVVARFETERQALALMNHPNIARVFDGGATPEGRPFFVMEMVEGIPITQHCDRDRLGVRERLDLFLAVCDAVQHAHQKGIIHRDIKPSNILVCYQDDRPVPKIIDFGVAKATWASLTDKPLHTQLGQAIGTPEYMSPEQAERSAADIDTRTDVYSLGVVLYELLVGARPFDSIQLILSKEPPKPSTRLGNLGETSVTVTRDRRTDPQTLRRQLRGDLDWILMKALEKDRTRRYGSPAELAADIQRFLKNEPVLATPPSTAYRTKKFVRRHRVGVASASTVLFLLIAFAITMTVQAGRIARERDRANQEAETARQTAEFLVGLFEVSDPSEALGNKITAREILDRGAARIQNELADQPAVQASLMETMGRVYSSLGLYNQARPLLEDALEVLNREGGRENPEVASALGHLGALLGRTGDFEKARPILEQALSIREQAFGPDHPAVADALNNLGTLSVRIGDYKKAEGYYDRALKIYEKASGRDHLDVARTLTNLAIVYRFTDRPEEARRGYERALSIIESARGPEHPDVAQALHNLAVLLSSTKRYDEARRLLERCLRIREKVLGPEHPDVARSLNNLANLLEATGSYAEARRLHERALAIREKALGPDHPDVAQSLNNLGILMKNAGELDAARQVYERALRIREESLGPNNRWVAISYYNLAGLAALRGKRKEALRLLDEAVQRGFDLEAIFDDPDLKSLQGDPEFTAIQDRVRARLRAK